MRVVGLVLVHLNNVQVHVNFKQNISMTLFIVAYLYVKKSCLNHLHQQKLLDTAIKFGFLWQKRNVLKPPVVPSPACTIDSGYPIFYQLFIKTNLALKL